MIIPLLISTTMGKQSTGRSEYQAYNIEHRADYYKGTSAKHTFFFHSKSPYVGKYFALGDVMDS